MMRMGLAFISILYFCGGWAVAADPIAYWSFENDFRDSSPAGLHARPLRGVGFIEGRYGKGVQFNGRSSVLRVPSYSDLVLGAGDMTLTLWARFPLEGSEGGGLVNKGFGETTEPGAWGLLRGDSNSEVNFVVANAAGDNHVTLNAANIPEGWHHLVVSRESGTWKLFVDSNQVAAKDVENVVALDMYSYLDMGRAGDKYIKGSLDEVRLYRGALDERAILMDMSKVPQAPELPGNYTRKIETKPLPGRPEPISEHPSFRTQERERILQQGRVRTATATNRNPPTIVKRPDPEEAITAEEPPEEVTLIKADHMRDPVIKATLEGQIQVNWVRSSDVPKHEAQPLFVSDAGIYLTGPNLLAARMDGQGNQVWEITAPGLQGAAITRGSNGVLYVTGMVLGAVNIKGIPLGGAGGSDIFVAAVSHDGQLKWAKSAGGKGFDKGRAIAVDHEGRVLVTGAFENQWSWSGTAMNSKGGDDLFVAAFDDRGKLVALLQAGSSAEDSGLSFYRTPEGSGVLLIGSVAGPTELGDKKLEGGGRFMARLQ